MNFSLKDHFMTDFSLRFAGIDDIPVIVSIINAAFVVEKAIIEGDRTDSAEIRQLLEKGVILIVEKEKEGLGSIYVELREDAAYFGLLAVSPGMQGKGLGRFLVESAENFAREKGFNKMTMRIIDQRKELPAFYEKLGYKIVSIEPFPEEWETLIPCQMVNMAKDLK